mgnify:CR=1 FL=1
MGGDCIRKIPVLTQSPPSFLESVKIDVILSGFAGFVMSQGGHSAFKKETCQECQVYKDFFDEYIQSRK